MYSHPTPGDGVDGTVGVEVTGFLLTGFLLTGVFPALFADEYNFDVKIYTNFYDKVCDIRLNLYYVLCCIKTLNEEELLILLNTDSTPIIVKSINDESLIQLILPIKTY